MVPKLTDQDFAGQASGVAIKYKLLGFEQLALVKERYFRAVSYTHLDVYKRQVEHKPSGPEIHLIQQPPAFHEKCRVPGHSLSLQLEENDGDSFMHPGDSGHILRICLLYTSRCV